MCGFPRPACAGFGPGPPGHRQAGHSEAVPFSQRQPGEETLTAILPVALDQLDFGVQVGAVRLGEEPEGVPRLCETEVFLLLAGNPSLESKVNESDRVGDAGHGVYLLLDLKTVRLPATGLRRFRPEPPGHRQAGVFYRLCVMVSWNSRPSGRVMTSPQSRVMRPASL